MGVLGVHALASSLQPIRRIRSQREPHKQTQGLPLNPIPRVQPHRRVLPGAVPGHDGQSPPELPGPSPGHHPGRRVALVLTDVGRRECDHVQCRTLVEPRENVKDV